MCVCEGGGEPVCVRRGGEPACVRGEVSLCV